MALRSSYPATAGLALATAAVLMLAARLPSAYDGLQHAAKAAAGRNELGGALATADSMGLNDGFVRAAFAYVPNHGRFAVVVPKDEAAVEKSDGVNPITFDGISPFFGNYLLPRREVATPVAGDFIICFYCDVSAWGGRTHWLGPANGGGRIGYIRR